MSILSPAEAKNSQISFRQKMKSHLNSARNVEEAEKNEENGKITKIKFMKDTSQVLIGTSCCESGGLKKSFLN